ncbi:MAG: hypothetical protein HFH87_09905 [Lachnospiraceae bacterium]|nr:hypothetical protein [Lachnospiraceae bacterium]
MARYIQNVTLNKPADFVSFIMNDYLQKNGFSMSDWKGEPAYRAGDAMMEGYKFLKWSYTDGVLHLEAWMKGSFGGEWGLDGFVGSLQKKPYKNNLTQLITVLQQPLPPQGGMGVQDGSQGFQGQMPNVVPVQTVDNSSQATWALVLGIIALVLCWSPIFCVIFGCLGFSRARMGAGSSKAGLAVAGKVLCIVAMCITLVLFILNIVLNMAVLQQYF